MAISMSRFGVSVRNREFFNLFEEGGANALHAGALLHRLLESWPDDRGIGREILICEQEGDRITHDVIALLNRKISPPFDRQDVYSLASALDDVVDYTEEAADFLALYHVEAPMEQAQDLSGVLRDSCRSLAAALATLHDIDQVHPKLVEIHRLENEGDRIVRAALAALFSNGVDPMVVVRWKDIFERIEQAIDACETAAHVIETIAVKQS